MAQLLGVGAAGVHGGSLQCERVVPTLRGALVLTIAPDLETRQCQRPLGTRVEVRVDILAREALRLSCAEIPVPGCNRRVRDGDRAERTVAKTQRHHCGVLHLESAHGVRGQRLNALDLSVEMTHEVDVMDQVDEDRPTAFLPPPRHIEVVARLPQVHRTVALTGRPSVPAPTMALALRVIGL